MNNNNGKKRNNKRRKTIHANRVNFSSFRCRHNTKYVRLFDSRQKLFTFVQLRKDF